MSEKPSYLGLLNALSLAESAAHEYLRCWIAVTPHDGVRSVLETVAAREGEHGLAFAKRVNELGFTLKPKDDPGQAERMRIAASTTMTDLEKMEALGLHRGGKNDAERPDAFAKLFFDHTIDIQTGELLGRYICEERDSGRLLRACHAQLVEECGASTPPPADRIAAIDAKVDALCGVVEELRELVASAARSKGNGSGNGAKRKAAVG